MPSSTIATQRTTTAPPSGPLSSGLPGALRVGALAAVATWALVVLPSLIAWIAAPESSLGWFSAVAVGSALWFLGHAQSVGSGNLSISLTPILLLLVNVYIGARFFRRLRSMERTRCTHAEWSRLTARSLVTGFLGGYLVISALVALLTLGGPANPGLGGILGALLVPVLSLGMVLLRPDAEEPPAFVRAWFDRGPTWLPAVWKVGWHGAGLLLVSGLAVVLARVVVSIGAVFSAQGDYGVNVVATGVVAVAQLLMIGNAATWALAFLAGPGFSLAVGATITPAAAHPGLMPLIPMLAALPEQADYPTVLYAVVLVPVAIGVLLGRWVDRELDFFGNVRARFAAVTTAAVISVLAVTVLAALGNGALGVDRLSSIGVPVPALGGALLLEVVGGAALWVGWRLLRERRPERADQAESGETDDTAEAETAEG